VTIYHALLAFTVAAALLLPMVHFLIILALSIALVAVLGGWRRDRGLLSESQSSFGNGVSWNVPSIFWIRCRSSWLPYWNGSA
jgi:hypothetical protein